MSITTFLQRTCTQTAVYWEYDGEDGYGGKEFKTPVEIKCRWESHTNIITGSRLGENSEQIVCNAEVYVLQDIVEQSYMYLGTLDDLESDISDPTKVMQSRMVQKFEKIPSLGSTTEFLRKSLL